MANAHEHDNHHGPKPMPASLAAPEIVSVWRTRFLIVAVVSALVSLLFAFTHEGRNHLLRAYLMGYMTCFGFAGGGLVLLMLQHVSGGKWGLLLRRPLEAMTRTLPLVALFFVPIALLWKHLYQWALYPTADSVATALANHEIDLEHALVLNAKRAMLSPLHTGIITIIIFAVLLIFVYFLNKWSLERDADPEAPRHIK